MQLVTFFNPHLSLNIIVQARLFPWIDWIEYEHRMIQVLFVGMT